MGATLRWVQYHAHTKTMITPPPISENIFLCVACNCYLILTDVPPSHKEKQNLPVSLRRLPPFAAFIRSMHSRWTARMGQCPYIIERHRALSVRLAYITLLTWSKARKSTKTVGQSPYIQQIIIPRNLCPEHAR